MMGVVVAAVVALAAGALVLTVSVRRRRRGDVRARSLQARLAPYRSLPREGARCGLCELPETGPHWSWMPPVEHPGWDRLRRAVDGGDA